MISTKLMIFFMAQYAIITGFSFYEANYARAVYFIGAFIISCGVLMMK